jgi:hypothetical protein
MYEKNYCKFALPRHQQVSYVHLWYMFFLFKAHLKFAQNDHSEILATHLDESWIHHLCLRFVKKNNVECTSRTRNFSVETCQILLYKNL